jgi:hypothetical protein
VVEDRSRDAARGSGDSLYAKGNLGPARLQNRHQSSVGASRTAVQEWNVAA